MNEKKKKNNKTKFFIFYLEEIFVISNKIKNEQMHVIYIYIYIYIYFFFSNLKLQLPFYKRKRESRVVRSTYSIKWSYLCSKHNEWK